MTDVILVDDHDLVRTGIRVLVERSGDFRVVADVGNAAEGIALCKKLQPQLVVMDLSIPGLDGIEATSEIARNCPGTRVIALTAYQEEATVVAAIRAGASGYVLKKARMEELLEALRVVAAGGVFLSQEVSHCLYSAIQRDTPSPKETGLLDRLTKRELQVMRLVAQGMSNKEVADTMTLSPETVRSYRKSLMKKLGVHNVAGMTQLAIRAGLADRFIEPEDKEPQ